MQDRLEIEQTDEFDANLKSITSRLEQEKDEGVADVNQISAAQTGATAPSFNLNQVKAGMTSVVNIALPSQMVKH